MTFPDPHDDFRWFAERLDDPSLLDGAVDLGIEIAVPVGGKRRGGYVSLDGRKRCWLALVELSRHSGFPNLRIIPGDRETMDTVWWGEDPPDPEDIDGDYFHAWARSLALHGRHFGYSESAIRRFLALSFAPHIVDASLET